MCGEIGVVIKLECVIIIASSENIEIEQSCRFHCYYCYPDAFLVPVEDNIISSYRFQARLFNVVT